MSSSQSDSEPLSNFFSDAFFCDDEARQSSYPPPDIACNPEQLPYPVLSIQSPRPTSNYSKTRLCAHDDGAQEDVPATPLSVDRLLPESLSRKEDDSDLVHTGRPTVRSHAGDVSPLARSLDALDEHQSPARSGSTQPSEPKLTHILHDGSMPYSIQDAADRPQRTRRLVDDINAFASVASADHPHLKCGRCGSAFTSRSGLL